VKHLFWLTALCSVFSSIPVQAIELRPLTDCTIKVFREIRRTSVWTGKQPEGCLADIHVEKRPAGIFVTTWIQGNSEQGWERVSLSSAMGFSEIAEHKAFDRAVHDIAERATRIERCLNSIVKVNDPLECRDKGVKTYSAGDVMGIEHTRQIWLNDNGRHSVVEYAYGDTATSAGPPADLFGGTALPPGTELNIHILDTN
jgi:hypothetical protein